MLARYVNLQDQLTAIRELQSRQWEAHRSSSGKRVPLWMNLSRLERALLDARAIRRKLRGQVADMERDLSTGAEQDFEMAMEASTAVDETRDLRRQRDAWHLAASVLDGQVGLLLERPQQIVVIQAGSNGQKQELVPAKQHADIIVTPQQPATRESRLVQIPGLRDRLREAYAKDERFMVLDSDVIDEVLGRLLDIHLPEVTSVVYKVAADTYHSHSGDLPGKQNRYLPDGKLWKQSKPVLSDARLQEAQAEDSQITRYIQDKIVGRETAWIQDLLSGRDRHELDLEMVNRFLHVVRDMILEQYQIGKNGDPVYMGRRRTAAITMFDIPDSLTTESSIFKMRQALPVVLQLCDPAPASSQ